MTLLNSKASPFEQVGISEISTNLHISTNENSQENQQELSENLPTVLVSDPHPEDCNDIENEKSIFDQFDDINIKDFSDKKKEY